jgi:hypothetical protein
MSATTNNIYLPLPFQQFIELVKQLPKKEKKQLLEVLQDEQQQNVIVPEWQKQEVRKRIKKYNKQPELMVDEKTALKMINKM